MLLAEPSLNPPAHHHKNQIIAMLIYNFERILKARGIDKPFSFFVNAGFSDNFATKAKKNQVKLLRMRTLEKVCLLLNCTPNDLYDWIPDKDQQVDKDHMMNDIRKKDDKVIDITKALHSIPLKKLDKLEELIHQVMGPEETEE
jgi:DNA-binding Xre family transcriptional regulator